MLAYIDRFPYFGGAKVMVKDIPRTKDDGNPTNTLLTKTYKYYLNQEKNTITNFFNRDTNFFSVQNNLRTILAALIILPPMAKATVQTEEKNGVVPSEKMKALKLTIDKIDKDFGKGSVMMMNEKGIVNIDVISTGSIGLDVALGIGGLPRGRIVEIYGPESSGKTTIAIHVIAEAQKKGGICAIVDAEHAFDSNYAKKLGVDVDNLLISQPDYGEQALEIADRLILSGAIDVLVIDSVAALVPKGELEGEMGDSKMGLQARLMSQALRKLTATIHKTNTICIFINQLREKIGVMFGSPETTTGGNALKFYASVRLDIRRISQIKDGDQAVGNRARVKVVKNKVAPPFRLAEFDIIFGLGISKVGEIIDMGVELGIVQKSGSWFSYDTNKLGQGREAVKDLLRDNPELSAEIEGKIREKVKEMQGG
jgi:recombination protein RecA